MSSTVVNEVSQNECKLIFSGKNCLNNFSKSSISILLRHFIDNILDKYSSGILSKYFINLINSLLSFFNKYSKMYQL